MSTPKPPHDMSELDWIRHRIQRLNTLLPLVTDPQALQVINEMIGEASERVQRLTKPTDS